MVISYNLTRTRRVMANPPAPNIPRVEIPPMNRQDISSCTLTCHRARLFTSYIHYMLCRNLTFQNVDMEHIYHNCWIIRAKVLWKAQIRDNAMGNQYLRCILLDQHVSHYSSPHIALFLVCRCVKEFLNLIFLIIYKILLGN